MTWRAAIMILCALVVSAPSPSHACSLAPDYVGPTNFELVQVADAIVIASAHSKFGDPEDGGGITFRVLQTLKGRPPQRLAIEDVEIGRVRPSDLVDLSAPHRQSGDGMCNRYRFERGGRYLLFLDRADDGVWRQLGFPFSRINEDYAGENNPWMRSVRRYLAIQRTLAPMEQLAALRTMSETGRDLDGHRLARTERADIAEHLAAITPWKPTGFLLDLYARMERGEPLGAPWDAGVPPPDRLLLLRYLADGSHPGALSLFQRLAQARETHGRVRGLVLRYLARNGRYEDAYRWIATHLLAELPRLREDEALALLRDVAHVQRGDSWEEGRERWRADPHAAATWPELSRSIHLYQVRTFGENNALPSFDLEPRP